MKHSGKLPVQETLVDREPKHREHAQLEYEVSVLAVVSASGLRLRGASLK